jgi:hypothetical protein
MRETVMKDGNFDTTGKPEGSCKYGPLWVRLTISAILLFHATAIWVGAWADRPSSPFQQRLAEAFRWYYGLIDQGYSYRYYANGAPPTPVVTAVIQYADGRTDQIRIPDRKTQPRLLHQRELALANHLNEDVRAATQSTGDPSQSRWAQSYARHLGRTHPGARSVTLSIQEHRTPDPARVLDELRRTRRTPEIDAEEFYTVPERIGEFPCDAS